MTSQTEQGIRLTVMDFFVHGGFFRPGQYVRLKAEEVDRDGNVLRELSDKVDLKIGDTFTAYGFLEPVIDRKLWLWKNGDHFLAFEHLYPCISPGGDPLTLGEPVGYAILKPSFDRACGGRE